MRWSAPFVFAALAALSACAGDAPPRELAGLWSQGPAACDAGIGVRFASGAIAAHYAEETQTLLDHPHYAIERRGERLRVRIRYTLPQAPGAEAVTTRGVLVLERGGDGWLQTMSHRLEDRRTGSARTRIGADPVAATFRLRRCGPEAWIGGLRGRREA